MKQYLSRIYAGSGRSFCEEINTDMIAGRKRFIVTANPEILMKAEKSQEIADMLLDPAVTIVPDGVSVVQAMHAHNLPAEERITGVDITEHLLMSAGENGLSVFLFGAKEEVVGALSKNLKRKYPNIKIIYRNGYEPNKDEIFEGIRKLAPDLVIVALGVPVQEQLIYKHISSFRKGIFIGVGGSLDILSGKKKRAPKFFIKTKTEWLYRIIREPSRIKRFYNSNIKFMKYMKKK